MPSPYKYVYVKPGHPLLPPGRNRLGEHRLALWETIGPGSHPCAHCGVTVTWSPGKGGRKGCLVVDHLDDNPRNNDPANLLPSCTPCNQQRTPDKNRVRDDEPWLPDSRNHRVRAVVLHCLECNKEFKARRRNVPSAMRKFCGLSCVGKHRARVIAARGGPHNAVRDDELFVMKGSIRCRAIQKNCDQCGTEFLVVKSSAARARFCGSPCKISAMHQARKDAAATRRVARAAT